MKTKDVMNKHVIAVKRDTTVQDIAKLLLEHGIRAVPVVDDNEHVIGIVAEGDLVGRLRRMRAAGPLDLLSGAFGFQPGRDIDDQIKKITAASAADIMTTPVITVKPDTEVSKVAAILIDRHINQVPVVDENVRLVGIISRADIVRLAIG
jgi:CBS domain-containing protein